MRTRVIFLKRCTGHLSLAFLISLFLVKENWLLAFFLISIFVGMAIWVADINYVIKKSAGYKLSAVLGCSAIPILQIIEIRLPEFYIWGVMLIAAAFIYSCIWFIRDIHELRLDDALYDVNK